MRRSQHLPVSTALILLATLTSSLLSAQDKKRPGYTDTPILPGQKWRVHDAARPQPRIVAVPAASAPQKAPADAKVLFAGKDLGAWTGRKGKASWKLMDGFMECNKSGDIQTRESFGDCQLHIEWATPKNVQSESQGRGNSGVFFFGRYELQVLDSYDNPSYADGQAGALYGQHPPLVNASRGPGEWQSFDIIFTAPRFKGGKLISPARMTVLHNGVLIHNNQAMVGATAHRRVAKYSAHGPRGPIKLQDHGNPIRYRNIWIRDLTKPPTAASSRPASRKANR